LSSSNKILVGVGVGSAVGFVGGSMVGSAVGSAVDLELIVETKNALQH
jgi:hypothetical protein